MKKFLIATIAFFLFAATTNAQKKKSFAWNKKVMTEIGLSAEQQEKVEGIKTSSTKEMDAVKADAAMAEDAKKTKLQELQKKRLASIDALLTEEQNKTAKPNAANTPPHKRGPLSYVGFTMMILGINVATIKTFCFIF